MKGKTCLVTGGNSGIGKATAMELAALNARVVIVCRNQEKGKAAVNEIKSKTGSSQISLLIADLVSMKSVRALASQFEKSEFDKLNVLINNAGSHFPRYIETEEGFESTFALNYLAPFLLTNLLLGMLEKSAPSRIINVSSVGHMGATLDLENLGLKGNYRGFKAYSRSKLALTLFTYELSRRLTGTHVTANCLHPGAVRTNIWSHAGPFTPVAKFGSLFMRSSSKGAETVVYLASSQQVEGTSGKYFVDMKERNSSRESYNEPLAKRLWEKTEELVGGLSVEE